MLTLPDLRIRVQVEEDRHAIQPDHGETFDVPFVREREHPDHYPDEAPELPIHLYRETDIAALLDTADQWLDDIADFWADHPLSGSDAIPLMEYLDAVVKNLRSQNTASTQWLARQVGVLADEARQLHALTAEQFDDRNATYTLDFPARDDRKAVTR